MVKVWVAQAYPWYKPPPPVVAGGAEGWRTSILMILLGAGRFQFLMGISASAEGYFCREVPDIFWRLFIDVYWHLLV